jgi:hypothetical protein
VGFAGFAGVFICLETHVGGWIAPIHLAELGNLALARGCLLAG